MKKLSIILKFKGKNEVKTQYSESFLTDPIRELSLDDELFGHLARRS